MKNEIKPLEILGALFLILIAGVIFQECTGILL
jgi:hypothetical protein